MKSCGGRMIYEHLYPEAISLLVPDLCVEIGNSLLCCVYEWHEYSDAFHNPVHSLLLLLGQRNC